MLRFKRITIAFFVILLVVIAVQPLPAAQAFLPHLSGKIVFVSDRSGVDEIYVMNADGTQVTALTHDGDKTHINYSPHWSRDGKRLFYLHRIIAATGLNEQMIVINADGSKPVVVAQAHAIINTYIASDWSPDDKQIVYGILQQDTPGDLRSIYFEFYLTSSTREAPIALNPEGNPSYQAIRFLPDGSLIAVDQKLKTYQLDSSGENVQSLPFTLAPTILTVAADGKQFAAVAINNPTGISVFDLKTGSVKASVKIPTIVFVRDMMWSPDSRLLWVQGNEKSTAVPLPDFTRNSPMLTYIISADGHTVSKFIEAADGNNTRLSWSPDSQYLVYHANKDGHYQIYVSRLDGSGAIQLTNDSENIEPAWQPGYSYF